MSETPRTDAEKFPDTDGYGDPIPGTDVVPVEFARQLERELAALKADAERYRWLLGKGSVEKDRGLGLVTINFSFPCLGPRPGIEEAIIRARGERS